MSDFFFSFSEISEEIKKKNHSLKTNPKKLCQLFLERTTFSDLEKKDILSFFLKLQKFNFDKIYKNYLTHPIRLCDMYFQNIKNVNVDDIKFILSHNIIECDIFKKFKNNLTDKQVKKIQILTIDRKREKNQLYLKFFYDQIFKHSTNLFIFKSLDKMDNALIGDKILFSNHALNIFEKHIFTKLKKNRYKLYLYQKKLLSYAKKNILKNES